ncbi:F-box domain-containing protein [Orpheovirus IHUMI-LCC2]|uniref:F-box domain-containing protein n=1 Tax=Orpheovirus IHUMI-LCC2 TaxID=2023057 RepID=A0A2I2L5E4_9VIRU|nr:F-box domain-containing protein [Orpheovirus IHUMI-LCC2]SNW62754.1 F-box domain-containing protein [Orpheovirus IHUMI-LCC2]
MDNVIYPNALFPTLPKEISNKVFTNINPEDILNVCSVNKDTRDNYCSQLIRQAYGNDGYEVIKELNNTQFIKLHNMCWPSLSFLQKQNFKTSLQLLDRSIQLGYLNSKFNELQEMFRAAHRVSHALDKTKLQDLLISHNMRLGEKQSIVQYKTNNEKTLMAKEDYIIMKYVENGEDLSKFRKETIIKILKMLPYSSYPSLAFRRLEPYIFDNTDDGMLLKGIYELPIEECNQLIMDNIDNLESYQYNSVLFYVYTQRKEYDIYLATYLIKYVISDIVNENASSSRYISYCINIGNYELYKLAMIVANRIGGTINPIWNQLLNRNVNTNVLIKPPYNIFKYSILNKYSDVRTYYNALFTKRIYDELNRNGYMSKLIDDLYGDVKSLKTIINKDEVLGDKVAENVLSDFSIIQLFILSYVFKEQFLPYLKIALDNRVK